ncbi:MAG TPA: hypothetical protein HA292_03445 [Candidatus Nitrosotenuis sp.]|nr:hypothetical protein [Candidatus Nitrosotenuis sp.]HII04064.1 hypothetical protein [Candidatus Nitrosotenuis sp.]
MANKTLIIPLAIMIGASVIGLTFPFWNGVPGSEQNVLPRFASQWYVGKGADAHPTLKYSITTKDRDFFAKIQFLDKTNDFEKIKVMIDDKKTGQHVEQTLTIGEAFVFIGVNDELKPYIQAMDGSLFSVRDTLTGSKYLVVGAEWGTTYVGKFTPKLKVTQYSDTKFAFGDLKTFLISYKINEIENKLWVTDNIPLPVKAQYYDIEGNPDYSYELVEFSQ